MGLTLQQQLSGGVNATNTIQVEDVFYDPDGGVQQPARDGFQKLSPKTTVVNGGFQTIWTPTSGARWLCSHMTMYVGLNGIVYVCSDTNRLFPVVVPTGGLHFVFTFPAPYLRGLANDEALQIENGTGSTINIWGTALGWEF